MPSKQVFNSSRKYSDDKIVVIDIYQKLKNLPVNEQNCRGVCVCRVPKWLSSTNPEYFVPQFVGLGPYHHLGGELTMTDEMKLGVANRVPKVKDLITDNGDVFDKHLTNYVSDIQSLYHTDVCSNYDSQSFLYLLTVDGLFLLGLLYTSNHEEHLSHYYYILTGRKHGMPLINLAGVELTTDGVIQDVFMLENQIPTHVLKHLNRVNIKSKSEIQSRDEDLGLAMRNFCEQFCPLIHSENLSNNLEDHDHLLDLMYHMIASQSEPEPQPEPEPETKAETKPGLWRWIIVCAFLLSFIFVWTWIYYIVLIFSLVLSLLGMVRWLLTFAFGKLQKMPSYLKILGDVIDNRRQVLSKNEAGKPYAQILGQIHERTRICSLLLHRQLDYFMNNKAATLPSAIELHSVGVQLQPAEGGISSFKFDKGACQLYLPSVRLDAKSEVIMRNLVTYESLTKSNGLIFTRYIQLMSDLILSAEDVKLLVDENIIQTRLSHEVVARVFSGTMINKSTRPTKTRNLEEEIMKVIGFYREILLRKRYLPLGVPCMVMFIVGVALTLAVADSLVKSHCNNNHDSILCKLFQVGDYGLRNNYLISSM